MPKNKMHPAQPRFARLGRVQNKMLLSSDLQVSQTCHSAAIPLLYLQTFLHARIPLHTSTRAWKMSSSRAITLKQALNIGQQPGKYPFIYASNPKDSATSRPAGLKTDMPILNQPWTQFYIYASYSEDSPTSKPANLNKAWHLCQYTLRKS